MRSILCLLFVLVQLHRAGNASPVGLPDWAIKHTIHVGKPLNCAPSQTDWKATVNGIEIKMEPYASIFLQGRDRGRAVWRVVSEYAGGGGCRLYVYDLDRNGYQDLIFMTSNGGSGPNGITMIVITFDGMRRPIPWEATGRSTLMKTAY